MNREQILENILDTAQKKYDRTLYMHGFADEEDYMWVLGREVYWALTNSPELRYPSSEDLGDFLFGIPCVIDRKNEWRISLVKEIK